MSGNSIGGKKAALKNKEFDPDFYVKIGTLGGQARVPKGMSMNRELAKTAGAKGGRMSKPYSVNPKEKK